jgi:hypothetical protein
MKITAKCLIFSIYLGLPQKVTVLSKLKFAIKNMLPEAQNYRLSVLEADSYNHMLNICCKFVLIILYKCKENGHMDK